MVTNHLRISNRLYNVPVVDLVYLTCLRQGMTKIIFKKVAKIVTVYVNIKKFCRILGISGHGDRSKKLFGSHKRCCDGQ